MCHTTVIKSRLKNVHNNRSFPVTLKEYRELYWNTDLFCKIRVALVATRITNDFTQWEYVRKMNRNVLCQCVRKTTKLFKQHCSTWDLHFCVNFRHFIYVVFFFYVLALCWINAKIRAGRSGHVRYLKFNVRSFWSTNEIITSINRSTVVIHACRMFKFITMTFRCFCWTLTQLDENIGETFASRRKHAAW